MVRRLQRSIRAMADTFRGHRANRAQYSEVSFQSIVEDDVVDVALPSMQGVAEDEGKPHSYFQKLFVDIRPIALEALSALTVQEQPTDVFVTPPQLDGDLVTLTLLPRARWQTLLNLEVIQVRYSLFAFTSVCRADPMPVATEQAQGAAKSAREGAFLPTHTAWRRAPLCA